MGVCVCKSMQAVLLPTGGQSAGHETRLDWGAQSPSRASRSSASDPSEDLHGPMRDLGESGDSEGGGTCPLHDVGSFALSQARGMCFVCSHQS